MGAFGQLQGQQPQTLAHALADSPTGLIGWNGQLFGDGVDIEFALSNMAIYWFTRTSASSARFYYENAHADPATEPTTVPIGLAPDGELSGSRGLGPAGSSSTTWLSMSVWLTPPCCRDRSAHAARAELDADPRPDGLGRLGHGVLPRALARAAHDDQVAKTQGVAEGLAASARPE